MGSGGSLKPWESGAGAVTWWLKAPIFFLIVRLNPSISRWVFIIHATFVASSVWSMNS